MTRFTLAESIYKSGFTFDLQGKALKAYLGEPETDHDDQRGIDVPLNSATTAVLPDL